MAIISQSPFELREEQIDSPGGKVLDQEAARTERDLANRFDIVRQAGQDGGNDLPQVVGKTIAKTYGQKDEERHEAFPDSRLGGLHILKDGRECLFEARSPQSGQDFAEGLRRTQPIPGASVRLESLH